MDKLKQIPIKENLLLLSSQKRLWILAQQDKNNPGYNLQLTYHIRGEINYEIFNRSLSLLFEKHNTMFSVFKHRDGIPYIDIIQRVVKVELIDFSDEPKENRRESILSFASKDSKTSFDIENGPLYRVYLLKEDNENYFFHATVHHLIFDGWSRRIFVQELSRIYSNLSLGIEAETGTLSFQSYDYAEIENKSFDSKKEKELMAFWRDNLVGCQTELKFPFDFKRKSHSSGYGRRELFEIPRNYTDKIKELGTNANATVFNTVLSILAILFQKYSGENDISIGIPVSNRRMHPSLGEIFGLFINTAVVRLKIDDKNKFCDYLSDARNVVMNAITHSGLPFEKIVEAARPERIPGINPLFQVSLSWLTNQTIPLKFGSAIGERYTLDDGVSHFDMTFYMWEDNGIIKGEIEYSNDLLKQETVARLKNNLLTLIKNLVENPDMPIDSLSIISEEEKLFIDRINDTKTDYPKEKSIVELFEEQVSLYPDKLAVVFKGSSLTYNELNERANQLAGTLRKLGVRIDTPVGVYVDKSLEMIVGILGILKSGGAYLPIDPDYPVQRVDFIIKESGCNVLLTQGKYMDISFPGVTKLDLNSPVTYQREKTDIERINSSTDLAYFMYTSGTTGVPKGSMIRHYSVIRTVRNVNYMEMTSDDRILYTSAIVFDVTTYEIWGALLNGMTLYVVEKETILDAAALGKELAVNEITILHLTSALFTQLAESRTDIFSGLRYLLIGGDVLSAPHINKVRKDNPGLKVINCYGPSENTTYSTTYLIDKTHEINIPIGKPISNSTVYIFDKHMNYQPIGVMGEIYVGGDGLSKGYLNREDLNSRSFIEHPYISGERLYKTGDFGRWLSDGNIEFQGRVDNQIKIRGFRVELEEIESVISKIEGVIESVIKPVKVEEGDYRLVAFLNVPETFKTEWKEISRQLKERLPSYMVPTAYRFLHGFPKTINGKTDKKALTIEKSELENTDVRERGELTATEKEIYRIWSDALKTSDITTADNFFDIGGTSLLAISVFTKIEKAFKVEMGLRVFFDSPRIMDLARVVDIERIKNTRIGSIDKKSNNDSKMVTGEL